MEHACWKSDIQQSQPASTNNKAWTETETDRNKKIYKLRNSHAGGM
jgi:hypothetical protein